MQFLSAKPLIEKFRTERFGDEEVAWYFVASIILRALAAMPVHHATPWTNWHYVSGIGSFLVTVCGIFHLKRRNENSFGRGYLNKFFALGWVVGFRMILIGVPVFFGFMLIGLFAGGDAGADAMSAIFDIVFGIVFYWWLGSLFAEAQASRQDEVAVREG